ncbi:MAG: hypothetical protein VYC34_02240 [Planctomycetota bacterium]|nr:hypothetical protein [Planctomycetota bacterium]
MKWTRIVGVIDGDALHLSIISSVFGRVTARRGPTLERFLSMRRDEVAAGFAGLPNGRVTLVCPTDWCAVRPIQMRVAGWRQAREEIRHSVDRLLPLQPDDAMLGLIDVGADADPAAGACLVGVRRSAVQAWIDAVEQGADREVATVISPHMAMLGLGLQHEARSEVVEPAPGGFATAHRLAWGRPVEIGAPDAPAESGAEAQKRIVLPGGEGDASSEAVTWHDLAVAAALAPEVAPDAYSPLVGRTPSARTRWIPAAAAAVVALGLFVAAGQVYAARLEQGAEAARDQQQRLEDEVRAAHELRRQAERRMQLLDEGIAASTSDWRSVLPAIADVHAALGEDGHLRRLQLGPDSILLGGEAPNAGALLERLEESERLQGATLISPVSKSSQSGWDVFDVRINRIAPKAMPGSGERAR